MVVGVIETLADYSPVSGADCSSLPQQRTEISHAEIGLGLLRSRGQEEVSFAVLTDAGQCATDSSICHHRRKSSCLVNGNLNCNLIGRGDDTTVASAERFVVPLSAQADPVSGFECYGFHLKEC